MRFISRSGQVRYRLGDQVVDRYLEFVAAGAGRTVSRSSKEAAVILRGDIPAGLRRVLACSCADCRDAAADRAE